MPAIEPSQNTLSHPISRYFFATRPPFLLTTVAACILGFASAQYSGLPIQYSLAWITVLLAAILHAAVNVLNDYYDAKNGTDDANTLRIYPFTGGSRFIQNGILTSHQMRNFGLVLLTVTIFGGLVLTAKLGLGLLWIGLFGTLIGWAYSAAPFKLNARGLGEWCVMLGFLGVVIGADFVQRQSFSFQPVTVGLGYALLVTHLLYINQFPDREADALAEKRTLVVRLQLAAAVWGYAVIVLLAVGWLIVMVAIQRLPTLAMLSLLPMFLSYQAFVHLRKNAATPNLLLPAIQLTLASMLGHAVLLSIILFWKAP